MVTGSRALKVARARGVVVVALCALTACTSERERCLEGLNSEGVYGESASGTTVERVVGRRFHIALPTGGFAGLLWQACPTEGAVVRYLEPSSVCPPASAESDPEPDSMGMAYFSYMAVGRGETSVVVNPWGAPCPAPGEPPPDGGVTRRPVTLRVRVSP